jgi:hypothetical protein
MCPFCDLESGTHCRVCWAVIRDAMKAKDEH